MPSFAYTYLTFDGVLQGFLKTPIHRTPEEVAAAQEKARLEHIKAEEAKVRRNKAISEFLRGAWVVGSLAVMLIWRYSEQTTSQSQTSNISVQPQPQQPAPPRISETKTPQKPKKVVSTQPPEGKHRNVKNTNVSEMHPIEKCMTIPDEKGMAHCLELAK